MLLGLDMGTTNVKAVLVGTDGEVLARGSAPVPTYHVGRNGVEQDIDDIWDAALSAVGRLASAGDLSKVGALGVSSQGGALQVLDGRGRPAGRVVSWLDGRAAPYSEELNVQLGRDWLLEHVGHGSVGLGSAQLRRLRAEAPDLLQPPAQVGFVGDVIVSRLCGRRAHDTTSLSIALLLNPSLGEAEPELLARLGVAEEQLPDLLGPRTAAGGLLPEVAERTGLPAGIPVSAAVHDQYAAALGCGAVHPGDVMFGAGTAWVLLAVAEDAPGRERPVIPRAFACTHLVEGLWGQMLSMVNGGSAFRWAVELLGLAGRDSSAIDAMIDSVPPGSEGVRFRPLLTPGGGSGAGAGGRGRLDGLSLSTTREQVLRAVVEGLAMELRRHVGLLSDGGLPVGRLIMCGEAAASRATPPILAEATGCPLACVTEGAVSALGAAVLARGLLETEDDLASLAEEMAPPVRRCEPGEHVDLYAAMFGRYVESLPATGDA